VSVATGVDLLLAGRLDELRGKRLGLVVNHTALTADGRWLPAELIRQGLHVSVMFAPEHGLRGDRMAAVADERDPVTGVAVRSLYREHGGLTPELPADLDAVIYCLQDIGSRFWTYTSTLLAVMEAAQAADIPVWVCDRPNPLGGRAVAGPPLLPAFRSFVGIDPLPIRHGMTSGELALLLRDRFAPSARVEVVAMAGWRRAMWHDQTGLPYLAPSPNAPSLAHAIVHPGHNLFKGLNVSEGYGTAKPCEWKGAPWIDGVAWAEALNARALAGVVYRPVWFRPARAPTGTSPWKYEDEPCQGVEPLLIDRDAFEPVAAGLHMVDTLLALHGERVAWPTHRDGRHQFDLRVGNDRVRQGLLARTPVAEIVAGWGDELREFERLRAGYLLY
jgi:uncharacterized protein YbbC (DUF1343 family)